HISTFPLFPYTTLFRSNFAAKSGQFHDKPTIITSAYPSEHVGLQVIDYYLWALQRLLEWGEYRFFTSVAKDYRLIVDIDDTRRRDRKSTRLNSSHVSIS